MLLPWFSLPASYFTKLWLSAWISLLSLLSVGLAWLVVLSLGTWCVCPCCGLFTFFFLVYILQGTHLLILDLPWHVSECASGIVFFCLKLFVSSSYDISNHMLLAFIYFYTVFYQFIHTMYFYHIYPHSSPLISPGLPFISFLISFSFSLIITHFVQLVLPIYAQVWVHLLEFH